MEDRVRLICNRIERGHVDQALSQATTAVHKLPRAGRDRLAHRVADRLEARGRTTEAALLMVELANVACGTGDLTTASEAVERAVGLWTGTTDGDAIPPWLTAARDRVRNAWAACSELVEWRRDAEERQREHLRSRYRNRRVLIAGGMQQPDWKAKLEDWTGATIDWAPHYRGNGDDLDRYADRIRNGHYDVVIHFVQKCGHEVQNKLKPAAQEAGVPFTSPLSAGFRGFVEALASLGSPLTYGPVGRPSEAV